MKKKLISLMLGISMIASLFVTSVSATIANSSPVYDVTVEEMTAEDYEEEWVGEPLEEGHKAYLLTATLAGLELNSKCTGTSVAKKKQRDGSILMNAGYQVDFSEEDSKHIVLMMPVGGWAGANNGEIYAVKSPGSAPEGYPSIADGDAEVTADSVDVVVYVVETDGTSVSGTQKGTAKITEFTANNSMKSKNYYNSDIVYKCNGEVTQTVTFAVAAAPVPSVTSVTVTPKTATLEVGSGAVTKTTTLTATVTVENGADKTVTWTTSDAAVATVADGVVTAVGEGTATITATSTVDGTKADTCAVTVVEKKISVEGITVSIDKAQIEIGDTATASVACDPENADEYTDIRWKSSNDAVATVVNGVVTGVKAGTATITATSANGKTDAVEVTVVRPARKITIGDRFVGTEVKGFVWNVKVQWFDGKALNYTFTDKADNATKEGVFGNVSNIEADNMSFDVVMRTNKADVVLTVK